MAKQPVPGSIEEAILNLSKKRHVISDEAWRAKADYDQYKEQGRQDEGVVIQPRQEEALQQEAFSSQRSEAAVAVDMSVNPVRLFMLNFLVSLIRGIGFGLGLLILAFVVVYVRNHDIHIYLTLYRLLH